VRVLLGGLANAVRPRESDGSANGREEELACWKHQSAQGCWHFTTEVEVHGQRQGVCRHEEELGTQEMTKKDDRNKESDIVARLRNAPWTTADDCEVAADEIERLRHDLEGARLAYRGADYDRDRMRAERDEARREVCEWVSLQTKRKPREIAQNRGWDCFRVNPHCKYCQTHDDLMRESDDGMCVTCQQERLDDGP